MLNAGNFRLVYCQAVIFTPDLDFRANNALAYLLKYKDRLNAEPVTLPLPADSPPEIPRIILQSRDGQLKLQTGPSRLDVLQEAEDISPESLQDFLEFVLSVF